jgi:hypothetical protein
VDDVHFILRHAMTGAVFVIFTAIGFSIFHIDVGHIWPNNLNGDWAGALAALTLIAFPMIGITIQGAHYCLDAIVLPRLFKRGKTAQWFKDPARKYIATTVRKAVLECHSKQASGHIPIEWQDLHDAPPDAFFVWLYYNRATPHMIEWARRRRSYYYLGTNWAVAALAGFATAALVMLLDERPHQARFVLLGLGLVWAFGAMAAAALMKRDADTMEAIWAAAQVDPEFRDCLADMLPIRYAQNPSTS